MITSLLPVPLISNILNIYFSPIFSFVSRLSFHRFFCVPLEFLCFTQIMLCNLIQIQGVQEKLCSFTIHCNPSLAYIAVRDLQSSQRNASVQSLLLAGNFLYNQKQPSACEGENDASESKMPSLKGYIFTACFHFY